MLFCCKRFTEPQQVLAKPWATAAELVRGHRKTSGAPTPEAPKALKGVVRSNAFAEHWARLALGTAYADRPHDRLALRDARSLRPSLSGSKRNALAKELI